MCGIAGLYDFEGADAPKSLLLTMAGELSHRGPDGVGLYLDGAFGMINTRLSIIDLAGGDQPISNEAGTIWAMQNGEIYNHVELRAELEGLGHDFLTRSDTEVLVHAYEQWGENFVDKLNGEFAVALFDRRSRELLLARDRFGIRPLFLANFGGEFAFASEAKALLRHPKAERRIDPYAVAETFVTWAVQGDRTAFVGVRELPPGHLLKVGPDGAVRTERWWDIEFAVDGGGMPEKVDALAEELLSRLDEATRIRLRSDVPVGVYLSGGLDSSVTAALAQRHAKGPLEAFALSFDDPRFDESSFQDTMARSLGVNLNRVVVSDADVARALPEVVRLAEKPILRTAPGPMLLLSRLVRDSGYKVVLTGEGSDELLGGYQIFQEAMVRRFWARQPDSRLRPLLLGRLYPYLSRDLTRGGGFMAEFFRSGMEDVGDPLYSHRPRFRTSARNLRFLSREARGFIETRGDPLERLANSLPASYAGFGPLGQAQYMEIKSFLSGYLLSSQGDRMLMGNSVEGRFPFLDVNVAEFAAALPERLRMNGIQEKYLLRKAMQPFLPDVINQRPKRPYRAPIARPFFGPHAPEYVRELLHEENISKAGLFDPQAVGQLVKKADRLAEIGMSESDEMGLVGVLSTALLQYQLVEEPKLAAPAEPSRVVDRGEVLV